MNHNEKVEAAIKDPSLIAELLTEESGEANSLFKAQVAKTVKDKYLDSYVQSLLNEKETATKPRNPELFKQMQDASTNYFGDVTEESLRVAVASYLANDGDFDEVEVPDIPLLFGELYGLESEDELVSQEAKLSTASRDKLPEGAFCGPNRSFPVHDKAHAVAAMRLLGRYKSGDKDAIRSCIERKAKSMGVGTSKKNESEGILTFYPIIIETGLENQITPLSITNKDELQSTLNEVESISKSYGLTPEQTESLKLFLAELEENTELFENSDPLLQYKESDAKPVSLNQEFLANFFLSAEQEQKDYLTALVGLVRTKKITKEEVEQSANKYRVFGQATLKVLLNKGFNENVQTEQIQTIPSPVDQIVTESDADSDLPHGLFTKLKTTKGSRKNPNSKEKN